MSKSCTIRILDEVNCVFVGLHPDHIGYFYEEYAAFAPNHYFNPKFKLGTWDGKIRYFYKTGKSYVKLLDDIIPRIIGLGYRIKLTDARTVDPVQPKVIDASFLASKGVWDIERDCPWEMRDYQVDMCNALIANGGGVGIAGTGGGKANDINSLVLTTSGWIRMGDITLDHEVITPSGDTANVIGIYPQGVTSAYEVIFHDGSKTITNPDHLWKVKRPINLYQANTKDDIYTTQQMLSFLEEKQNRNTCPGNISIPLTSPVKFRHVSYTQEIDPYVIGVLLGDGCLRQRVIRFTSIDDEIINEVTERIQSNGMQLSEATYSDTKQQMDWNIVLRPEHRNKNTYKPLAQYLDKMGIFGCKSHNKFIPNEYKYGSIKQRFDLVQGLLDTDGTVGTNGSVSFTTVSEQLATDFQEVMWSLGGTCNIRSNITLPTYTHNGEQRVGKKAYHCIVGFNDTRKLFKLSRKQERCGIHGDGRIELMRRVKEINPVSDRQTQCIKIDHPEHLYITDDYIVTHNTGMCAALAHLYEDAGGLRSIIIVPDKNLTIQTIEEYKIFKLDVGEYSGDRKDLDHQHIVSTWQSLKNNPKIIQSFDVIIVDECFDGNTQVSMNDGTTKNIKDIVVGDEVISYNIKTQQYEPDVVVKVYENMAISSNEDMYELEFDDNTIVKVTGNHKILTTDGYIRADKLTKNHEIVNLTYEDSQI